ncbi:TPA: cytoplasmic protein, partial [Escherichia coli]|nr:cytoplasmic protein [Escherichia coli]
HDFTQSALLSAGRVTQMLTSLALKYNESLTPSC